MNVSMLHSCRTTIGIHVQIRSTKLIFVCNAKNERVSFTENQIFTKHSFQCQSNSFLLSRPTILKQKIFSSLKCMRNSPMCMCKAQNASNKKKLGIELRLVENNLLAPHPLSRKFCISAKPLLSKV